MGQLGQYRTLVAGALAALLTFVPGAASACRLALLLALDVSSSIDAQEYALQRDGLAEALTAPEVVSAFLSSPDPVALAAYEWSGQRRQVTVFGWRVIRSEADLVDASRAVGAQDRTETGWPTSLGAALAYGAQAFETAPQCLTRTIDVSGDGRNNDGFPPELAYKHFAFEGITVNALAIGGAEDLATLVDYFERRVIRGPRAFVEIAEDHADFERAMRRKLEREVRALTVGSAR